MVNVMIIIGCWFGSAVTKSWADKLAETDDATTLGVLAVVAWMMFIATGFYTFYQTGEQVINFVQTAVTRCDR